MVAFAIPSRVALELDDGLRWATDITHFEGGCIWVYLGPHQELPFGASLRLVFRHPGEASLGMAGIVIWSANGRVAVEVQHAVDRVLVDHWSRGRPADASEFVRLHRTETPTEELSPNDGHLAHLAGKMNIQGVSTAVRRRPAGPRRSDDQQWIEGQPWRDGDTVEDRIG